MWRRLDDAAADTAAQPFEDSESSSMQDANWGASFSNWKSFVALVLLFSLICGMAAGVAIKDVRKKLGNKSGLLCGLACQFFILPFVGFLTVKMFDVKSTWGIVLLVVTTSPGGSYSNWWCSLLNADLALSVVMTTFSTIISLFMLPLNLFLYVRLTYGQAVPIAWSVLIVNLTVSTTAIFTGLLISLKFPDYRVVANKIGNVCGIALILFSLVISTGSEVPAKPWTFYCFVATPCVLGLAIASAMSSIPQLRLKPPERVAVAVECCYQNTGIAISVALSMFTEEEGKDAVGIPVFYGGCELLFICVYMLMAWKAGWTYAPPDFPLYRVLAGTFQGERRQRNFSTVGGSGEFSLRSELEAMDLQMVSLEWPDAKQQALDRAALGNVGTTPSPTPSPTGAAEPPSLPDCPPPGVDVDVPSPSEAGAGAVPGAAVVEPSGGSSPELRSRGL